MIHRADFPFEGMDWPLGRPPASELGQVVIEDKADFGWFIRFLVGHVLPESREGFHDALFNAEGIDSIWLNEAVARYSAGLYGGLPLGALLALWALWPERQHVVHGRLILAGHPNGSESLDYYDVACLMWAQLEVDGGIHHPFAKPEEAREAAAQLHRQLMSLQARPGATRDEVGEFAALLTRSARSSSLEIVGDPPGNPPAA